MAGSEPQRWDLAVQKRRHRVEVEGSVVRTVRWYVDGDLVATKRTMRESASLAAAGAKGPSLDVHFDVLGRARSVTLVERSDARVDGEDDAVGAGGIDLDPEPGSPAALRQQRIREHPRRHEAIAALGGVAKVVLPLLAGLLALRVAVTLPWPDIDLPRVPWPDLPWPDVSWPALPWPDVDLPDWQPPEWLRWVGRVMRYGWPVLLALVLAKLEVARRREQDELKARLRDAEEAPGSSD